MKTYNDMTNDNEISSDKNTLCSVIPYDPVNEKASCCNRTMAKILDINPTVFDIFLTILNLKKDIIHKDNVDNVKNQTELTLKKHSAADLYGLLYDKLTTFVKTEYDVDITLITKKKTSAKENPL